MPVESPKFDASIRDLRQIRGVTGDLVTTLSSTSSLGRCISWDGTMPDAFALLDLPSQARAVERLLDDRTDDEKLGWLSATW